MTLLDDDGGLSARFEQCLQEIFAKYCTPKPLSADQVAMDAYLTADALDSWAKDTNGKPFSQETKEEILEFMDVTSEGNLTFKGFLQIYQLQAENDPEETYSDLAKHGYDRNLTSFQSSTPSQ